MILPFENYFIHFYLSININTKDSISSKKKKKIFLELSILNNKLHFSILYYTFVVVVVPIDSSMYRRSSIEILGCWAGESNIKRNQAILHMRPIVPVT